MFISSYLKCSNGFVENIATLTRKLEGVHGLDLDGMVWVICRRCREEWGELGGGAAMLRVPAFTHLSSVTGGVEELVHVTVS